MLKNKIMVMDLDGTLLNQSKEISTENIKFIKEISKNNLIIIASGRNYKDVLKVIEKANLKQSIYKNIICSNGQLIYNIQNNELVKKNFISHFIAEKIINDLEKFNIYWYIIINNRLFCKEIKYNCEKYIENKRYKISIIRNFKDIPQNDIEKFIINMDYNNKIYKENFSKKYDINFFFKDRIKTYNGRKYIQNSILPRGVNKYTALRFILNKEKINREIIAIGDGINDYELLSNSNISICPESSCIEIKSLCKITIDINKFNWLNEVLTKLEM